MSGPTTIDVELSELLGDFVATRICEDGLYVDAGDYVRDLIRRDKQRVESAAFEVLKAELQRAFATPDDQYVAVSADEVIARNRLAARRDALPPRACCKCATR